MDSQQAPGSEQQLVPTKNGGLRDAKTGRIVKGPIQTSDHARAMQKRQVASRYAMRIKAAEAAIAGGQDPSEAAIEHGLQAVLDAQVQLAKDADKGHASTRAAEFVLAMGDFYSKADSRVKLKDGDKSIEGRAGELVDIISALRQQAASTSGSPRASEPDHELPSLGTGE